MAHVVNVYDRVAVTPFVAWIPPLQAHHLSMFAASPSMQFNSRTAATFTPILLSVEGSQFDPYIYYLKIRRKKKKKKNYYERILTTFYFFWKKKFSIKLLFFRRNSKLTTIWK